MKKRRTVKIKRPPAAPKVKKLKLPAAVVLHVEAPAGHVPVVVPGPDPHVVKIVPLPPEKALSWMEYFFGPERK